MAADDSVETCMRILNHLRTCCSMLCEGRAVRHRKSVRYWRSVLKVSSRFWDWPIVCPSVRRDCAEMGIRIPESIDRMNGVRQLVAFFETVYQPVKDRLLNIPAENLQVRVAPRSGCPLHSEGRFKGLHDALAPVKELRGEDLVFLLHGSVADGKTTAFSDIDDFVILRAAVLTDEERLSNASSVLGRLSRTYQNIDAYQHHGHWLVTELDLLAYRESILPLVALKDARRVSGPESVDFRVVASRKQIACNIRETVNASLQRLARNRKRRGLNAFELKELCGEIALLPALRLQYRAQMVPKAEAISMAVDMYSDRALGAIKYSTLVRDNFQGFLSAFQSGLRRYLVALFPRRCDAERVVSMISPRIAEDDPMGVSSRRDEEIRLFLQESLDGIGKGPA